MTENDDSFTMAIRRWNRVLILAMCLFIVVSYTGHKVLNNLFISAADLPQHARYVIHKTLPDHIGGGFGLESSADESIPKSEDGISDDEDSVMQDGEEVWVECRNICKG